MARRNPYNQPQPAEWETMSPKLKKRWRKAHWRPNEWMVVVPLKRFATRKVNQQSGAQRGAGMNSLAEKLEKTRTNPMKRRNPSPYVIQDVMTRVAPDGLFEGIVETNRGMFYGPSKQTRAAARSAVRKMVERMDRHEYTYGYTSGPRMQVWKAELAKRKAAKSTRAAKGSKTRKNPSAKERAADRAERKRMRAERKRTWREENARPLRENPKRRRTRR